MYIYIYYYILLYCMCVCLSVGVRVHVSVNINVDSWNRFLSRHVKALQILANGFSSPLARALPSEENPRPKRSVSMQAEATGKQSTSDWTNVTDAWRCPLLLALQGYLNSVFLLGILHHSSTYFTSWTASLCHAAKEMFSNAIKDAQETPDP